MTGELSTLRSTLWPQELQSALLTQKLSVSGWHGKRKGWLGCGWLEADVYFDPRRQTLLGVLQLSYRSSLYEFFICEQCYLLSWNAFLEISYRCPLPGSVFDHRTIKGSNHVLESDFPMGKGTYQTFGVCLLNDWLNEWINKNAQIKADSPTREGLILLRGVMNTWAPTACIARLLDEQKGNDIWHTSWLEIWGQLINEGKWAHVYGTLDGFPCSLPRGTESSYE